MSAYSERARENRVRVKPCPLCASTDFHERRCKAFVTWCYGRHAVLDAQGLETSGHCPKHRPNRGVIGARFRHVVVPQGDDLPWGGKAHAPYVICPFEIIAVERIGPGACQRSVPAVGAPPPFNPADDPEWQREFAGGDFDDDDDGDYDMKAIRKEEEEGDAIYHNADGDEIEDDDEEEPFYTEDDEG